jgi:hypothetical protein
MVCSKKIKRTKEETLKGEMSRMINKRKKLKIINRSVTKMGNKNALLY